jgi:hypothetical protein
MRYSPWYTVFSWAGITLVPRSGAFVNTNKPTRRNSRRNLVSYQTPETVKAIEPTETDNESLPSTVLRDYEVDGDVLGEIHAGTFSISITNEVKDENGKIAKKVVYENEKEPFEYRKVVGFPNLLKHLGGKLDDNAVQFLNQALAGDETGKAIQSLMSMANAKFKADAKSSAYQALVNKHKPLEGEKRETAIARTIANFVKLAGISAEVAIEVLKSKNAVPADYTVEDYNSTPLRRTKGDSDE